MARPAFPASAEDLFRSAETPKGTLLYDAVYLASNEKLNQETGRKAMIILTDGEDEGSRTKINDAIAAAQKSNAIIYVILIADTGFYGNFGFGYSGYSAAKKMAEETGGRVINVGNNGKKLEDAFQQIEDELRTQYVASYTPSNAKLDGTFRHIWRGMQRGRIEGAGAEGIFRAVSGEIEAAREPTQRYSRVAPQLMSLTARV